MALKVKPELIFTLARTQKPLEFKTQMIGSISLMQFMRVMKCAYSGLTLLLAVTDDEPTHNDKYYKGYFSYKCSFKIERFLSSSHYKHNIGFHAKQCLVLVPFAFVNCFSYFHRLKDPYNFTSSVYKDADSGNMNNHCETCLVSNLLPIEANRVEQQNPSDQ
ncbi:hypothetical protein HUJ04_010060 [Dendroctonus ponderosae]|nr:hypothetical protein HUJ04_010060 [Dendroctonus ponderosae]